MQDNALLTQYAQNRSDAAFSQLVARHLPLVYRTCRRELASDTLAEDAAQVVFLLLARKAKSLRAGPSLAGWLYQTAVFVAKDIRKQEARRTRREEAVMQQALHAQTAPAADWDTVEPHLNAALSVLKPADRNAVLLRFFEGHTLAETGALLGITEDAARMRVSRALDKMRRTLTAHGAAATSVVLAALLTTEAARPVPAHAAATITQETLQAISIGPAPNVLLLSKGVSHTMNLIKLKYAALAAFVVLAGAAVPPLVHAVSLHNVNVPVRISSAPLTSASSSQAPTLEQIQKLQLHDDFILKYTLVEKDVRTPEMKAADLKEAVDGLLDEAKQGLITQSEADNAVAGDKAGYALPSSTAEYGVVMSAREGKLLIICKQHGAHSYGLDINLQPVIEPYWNTVFLYDGQTSYWYTSMNNILHWQQGFRTESEGFRGPLGTHIVPGIGLPYLPLVRESKAEDASKVGLAPADLLQQPGDTGRRCAVRDLAIFAEDGKADPYVPGQVYAQKSPLGLKLTKMLTGAVDSPEEEWDYQDSQIFEGVWLPRHVHWVRGHSVYINGKPGAGGPGQVEDCQIMQALTTPLALFQFDMRTYLPPNAMIGVYRGEMRGDKELRFPYNPAGGTLEEQYQSAVNKQSNLR